MLLLHCGRVQIGAALQHLQMDVAFLGAFAADGVCHAQRLPGGHRISGGNRGLCYPAEPPQPPGAVLDALAARRLLPEVDAQAEKIIAEALEAMPKELRRRVLLAYLGFPFYDVATLPLLQNEGLTVSMLSAAQAFSSGVRMSVRGWPALSWMTWMWASSNAGRPSCG